MAGNKLNLDAFVGALDGKRMAEGLSWREVVDRSGVSPSTLTRLQQNRRPDIDTFAALVRWLGVSADLFLGSEVSAAETASSTAAHQQRGKGRPKFSERESALLSQLLQKAHELARELKR